MEKKGNRNLPLAKGATTDTKKDGVSSNRPWPRGGRRREPVGSSLAAKQEMSRKPQPQRTRSIDKRPRSRGNDFISGAVARIETTKLEDYEGNHLVELGSVFLPGSKKRSLNHLLQFSYTPRENYSKLDKEHGNYNNGNRFMATKKHKYNKEHFLQANCQFIVNDSGDYKQYFNNPDALVDWNLVEQVNIQVSEYPTCPICLYPPVAAKMTRCGHIYCWSCILHYLSLSDKPSRKCPICFDNVDKKDLKSVVAIPFKSFNVDDLITFKLMKRLKGYLIAYPADVEAKSENGMFNICEKGSKDVYSKLLLAKTQDVIGIIKREYQELKEQLDGNDDGPEQCFVEQALSLLKEREDVVHSDVRCSFESEKNSHQETLLEERFEELDINVCRGSNSSSPSKRFHYFYQASDGQHIYLHAINARMLEHTYGSLEFGPKTLKGKILEKEGGSMTEELRKKLRYLQHLPVTCQFEVAEIRLKSPDVTKETLEHFHEQIEVRRKRRVKRAKEEKRREKRIEVEENRKMGKYPHPNLHLESNVQFPEFGIEARPRTESETTLPSQRSSSPDLIGASSNDTLEDTNHHAGPSFAKMLASEKKPTPSWPCLKSSTSTQESPKLINVTGHKMKTLPNVRVHNDSDQELDGYEPVPSFNSSFGDAIARALERAEKVDEDDDSHQPSGKKKKKSKQKVLFATNMACFDK